MNSLILRTTVRLLISLLLIFSVLLLLRGHDLPGGGFAGGLVATTGWALYSLAFGAGPTRKALVYSPQSILGVGLLLSLLSGLFPMLFQKPFLSGMWGKFDFGHLGQLELGTSLIFDIGVYLVILGVALTIILSIEEEE
jgi:multicomponent Na+:H+ antiporter subunit B